MIAHSFHTPLLKHEIPQFNTSHYSSISVAAAAAYPLTSERMCQVEINRALLKKKNM